MDFSFSKQGLLDALEARRAWAVALDKKLIAKHAAAEKKSLVEFREKCRAALKWTYEEMKVKTGYGNRLFELPRRPDCPRSAASMLEHALLEVSRDGRSRYRITEKAFRNIHYLLSYDETAKPDVCA